MTTTATRTDPKSTVEQAARRLYDAEVALHCARQSHVDSWVAAAYERLHEAIDTYRRATTTRLA